MTLIEVAEEVAKLPPQKTLPEMTADLNHQIGYIEGWRDGYDIAWEAAWNAAKATFGR